MKTHLKSSAGVLALCLPALAVAQSAGPWATPPLHYQSAFADYKPWQDIESADWRAVNIESADWRAVNDALGAVAGSRGHASHGAAAPQAPSAPTASPSSMRHHGARHSPGGAK